MAGCVQHWPTITKHFSHFVEHQCKRCEQKLVLYADGQIYREPAHSCQWDPPNNSVTDSFLYALYTMPDCCYVFCPIALPTDATSLPMSGLSIESGCLTGPGKFCRTILRYTQDGRLAQMLHEKYTRRSCGDD